MVKLKQIDGSAFDYFAYKAGDITDLGITGRLDNFVNNAVIFRKYAVGYCEGVSLACRPRVDCVGVMFEIEDIRFWIHFGKDEFKEVFDI